MAEGFDEPLPNFSETQDWQARNFDAPFIGWRTPNDGR
jgi:hypothetical protein